MDRINSIGIGMIGLACALFSGNIALGLQSDTGSDSYIVTKYDSHDGQSLKNALDVDVTDAGYLYVATAQGLLQMDGMHMVMHSSSTESGFKTNRISRVYTAGNQVLVKDNLEYLYAFQNGIAHPLLHPEDGYHLKTQVVRKLKSGFLILDEENSYIWSGEGLRVLSQSVSSYDTWDVASTDPSTVFVLNTNGLYRIHNDQVQKLEFPDYFNPDMTYTAWLHVSGNLLRVAANSEIAAYNIQQEQWEKSHFFFVQDPETEIIHTKDLPDGERLLIGTTTGFFVQDADSVYRKYDSRSSLRYVSYFTSGEREILVGADGVWINHQKIFTPENSVIVDGVVDREGNVWVTVRRDGLYRISKNLFKNYTDLRITNTYSLVEADDGTFWVGSFENGLHQMSGERIIRSFTMKNAPLPTDIIRSIAKLRDGTIVAATWGAPPFLIKGNSLVQEEAFLPLFGKRTNTVEGFYEDPKGRWWIGTLDGLFIKEQGRYQPYFDKNRVTLQNVSKIIPSPYNDDLYFCTTETGLVILRNNEFIFPRPVESGTPVHVRDAYFLPDRSVLAATYEHGLQRYIIGNNSFQVQTLDETNGLPETGYHQFLQDTTGHFWISSNNGLLRILDDNLLYAFENGANLAGQRWFGARDGLFEPEFNGGSQNTGLVDRNNNFWFTNLGGLVRFNPYEMNLREITAQNLKVQQILSSEESRNFAPGEMTVLPKTARSPTIRFSHMSFRNNQTPSVWYKLDNRSGRWSRPAQPGFIQLSNLDAGTHRLHFSVTPARGEVLKSFEFRIMPYWYETFGFRLLVLLAVAGLAYLLFYTRLGYKEEPSGVSHPPPDKEHGHGETHHSEEKDTITEKQESEIMELIKTEFTNPDLSVTMISDRLNISKSALYREWNKNHSLSITDYITMLRLERAKELILKNKFTINEVADMSGFNSQSYFAKVFKKNVGVPPTHYTSDWENTG